MPGYSVVVWAPAAALVSPGHLLEYSISGGISDFLNQSLHCENIPGDSCACYRVRSITVLHILVHHWPVQGRRAWNLSLLLQLLYACYALIQGQRKEGENGGGHPMGKENGRGSTRMWISWHGLSGHHLCKSSCILICAIGHSST